MSRQDPVVEHTPFDSASQREGYRYIHNTIDILANTHAWKPLLWDNSWGRPLGGNQDPSNSDCCSYILWFNLYSRNCRPSSVSRYSAKPEVVGEHSSAGAIDEHVQEVDALPRLLKESPQFAASDKGLVTSLSSS